MQNRKGGYILLILPPLADLCIPEALTQPDRAKKLQTQVISKNMRSFFMAQNIMHLTDGDFQTTIAKGVTLVDFYATWCGPCRMIAPIVEQLAGKLSGKASIAKLDIDEAPQTTGSLQITSVPTLILFKDGKEVKRVVGVKDLDYLLNLVNSFL
jgi:thioredoxin 1